MTSGSVGLAVAAVWNGGGDGRLRRRADGAGGSFAGAVCGAVIGDAGGGAGGFGGRRTVWATGGGADGSPVAAVRPEELREFARLSQSA